MEARALDTSGAAAVEAHLVPALIEHNGPAAVQSYFRPKETGATVDGLPVLQCCLRGRNLAGVRLPLPEGFSGAVLECRRRDAEPPSQEGAGTSGTTATTSTTWAATGTFDHLHYYNHDAAPLKGDGLRRCMDWAELSAAVHQPIDPAAVTAAVQAAAAQPAS